MGPLRGGAGIGMTDEELEGVRKETSARVRVGCDDNHVHHAEDDCLVGDPRDITILKLVEDLVRERRVVREAARKLGRGWRG